MHRSVPLSSEKPNCFLTHAFFVWKMFSCRLKTSYCDECNTLVQKDNLLAVVSIWQVQTKLSIQKLMYNKSAYEQVACVTAYNSINLKPVGIYRKIVTCTVHAARIHKPLLLST